MFQKAVAAVTEVQAVPETDTGTDSEASEDAEMEDREGMHAVA
jgi:hypothetical protein